MTTRRFFLSAGLPAVCFALWFGKAPVQGDEPKPVISKDAENDLKKMRGEWVSRDDAGESTWKFQGNKLSIKTPSRMYEITLTLDPKAKPRPTVDLKVGEDSPNARGTTGLAIYKFEGEKKLLICMGAGDAERPTEFKSDFPKIILFELTRKEAAKE